MTGQGFSGKEGTWVRMSASSSSLPSSTSCSTATAVKDLVMDAIRYVVRGVAANLWARSREP